MISQVKKKLASKKRRPTKRARRGKEKISEENESQMEKTGSFTHLQEIYLIVKEFLDLCPADFTFDELEAVKKIERRLYQAIYKTIPSLTFFILQYLGRDWFADLGIDAESTKTIAKKSIPTGFSHEEELIRP